MIFKIDTEIFSVKDVIQSIRGIAYSSNYLRISGIRIRSIFLHLGRWDSTKSMKPITISFHIHDFSRNIDDLSEYRGGIEKYQLSHRISYDGIFGEEAVNDYTSSRHRLCLYGHRYADDDDQ